MRGRSLNVAVALLLLAPLHVAAQGGGPGGMGGGALAGSRALLEQGSVEFLAMKQAELQLTTEQVATLTELGQKWAEETKPSRDRIRAVLPAPGQPPAGDRQAMMQQLMELQPVMQKLMDDDQKALDEAMKSLSAEQQATARGLLEERRNSMRVRRGGG
jgi:Spy/CpxP family protein refolding chaperone